MINRSANPATTFITIFAVVAKSQFSILPLNLMINSSTSSALTALNALKDSQIIYIISTRTKYIIRSLNYKMH
jgi:hypothetical protein